MVMETNDSLLMAFWKHDNEQVTRISTIFGKSKYFGWLSFSLALIFYSRWVFIDKVCGMWNGEKTTHNLLKKKKIVKVFSNKNDRKEKKIDSYLPFNVICVAQKSEPFKWVSA